jgi:hypothetical protein
MDVVSRAKSSQNVRVVARSRLLAAPPDGEPSPDVWLPSDLKTPREAPGVQFAEHAEAVPNEPAAAAELGAQVQRLRSELAKAEKRATGEGERAQRAEREVARLSERIETMKRAAARAAALAHKDVKQTPKQHGSV